MTIIIFDFDDTVFDTNRLKNDVVERFVLHGIKRDVAEDAYHKAKSENGVYSLNSHICTINNLQNTEVPKDFYNWFENLDLTQYVFSNIEVLLSDLKQNHKLILLTKGENEFQNFKINKSGLAEHFAEIHITQNEKEIFLQDFLFEEPVIFINDKLDENQKVQEKFPHFRVSQKYEKGDI
jgi:FMN phosphatase YigB (HAD superfamily)